MMRTGLLLLAACALPSPVAAQRFLGKSDDQWVADLEHNDTKVRRSAAHALGKIGRAASASLRALVTSLGDQEAAVRDTAAFALGEIALKQEGNPELVRSQASDKLQERLGDADARVRRSAAYALGSCGAARFVEADLVRALGDTEATVRQNAAWALGKAGDRASPTVVQALIDRIKREDDPLALRDTAAALGSIGRPTAAPAAEPLARLLESSRDNVIRKTTLQSLLAVVDPSLAKSEPGSQDTLVRALRDAFRAGDYEVKGLIAGALDKLGDHAAPALADLAGLIDDDKAPDDARRNATVALTKMWPSIRRLPAEDAQKVIRTLARILGPMQPVEVRQFAAEVLARVGFPVGDPAMPALLGAIANDKDDKVRHRCVWAFLNCDNLADRPEALRVLRKALKEAHKGVRYDAARALARGLAASAGKEVIDVLDEMLHDPEIKIYRQTNADVKGGSESSGGMSSVKADVGGDARFMAAQALGFIGREAAREKIVRTLREMTASKDPLIRDHAVEALKRMGV